jgi:hypothetical protein
MQKLPGPVCTRIDSSKQLFADKNRYIYQQTAVINSSGRWCGAVLQFYSVKGGLLMEKRERLRDNYFKCSVHFCDTPYIYYSYTFQQKIFIEF